MNRKILSKIILTTAAAFIGAGGDCDNSLKTVTSDEMRAAEVFTSYRIEEYERDGDDNGECVRRITGRFWNDRKIFLLKPPSRATYNKMNLPTESASVKENEFGCDGAKAEFVLTDNQGKTKINDYELNKIKLSAPAEISREKDLRIKIEKDEKYSYDFKGWIESGNRDEPVAVPFFSLKNEAELAERLRTPENEKNLSYFLTDENLLVIPARVWSQIQPGDLKLNISVEQKFFVLNLFDESNPVRSEALNYKYSKELKSKLK